MGRVIYKDNVIKKMGGMNDELTNLQNTITQCRSTYTTITSQKRKLSGKAWNHFLRYMREIQIPALDLFDQWLELAVRANEKCLSEANKLSESVLDEDKYIRMRDNFERELDRQCSLAGILRNEAVIIFCETMIQLCNNKLTEIEEYDLTTGNVYDDVAPVLMQLEKLNATCGEVNSPSNAHTFHYKQPDPVLKAVLEEVHEDRLLTVAKMTHDDVEEIVKQGLYSKEEVMHCLEILTMCEATESNEQPEWVRPGVNLEGVFSELLPTISGADEEYVGAEEHRKPGVQPIRVLPGARPYFLTPDMNRPGGGTGKIPGTVDKLDEDMKVTSAQSQENELPTYRQEKYMREALLYFRMPEKNQMEEDPERLKKSKQSGAQKTGVNEVEGKKTSGLKAPADKVKTQNKTGMGRSGMPGGSTGYRVPQDITKVNAPTTPVTEAKPAEAQNVTKTKTPIALKSPRDVEFFKNLLTGRYREAFGMNPNTLTGRATNVMIDYTNRLYTTGGVGKLLALSGALLGVTIPFYRVQYTGESTSPSLVKTDLTYKDVYLQRMFKGIQTM